MKKWLALLLAAMMALALVACGDTPANNDNDNKDNDTKTEEFARGSWDGNVYTNDSLNLTVTPSPSPMAGRSLPMRSWRPSWASPSIA